MIALLLLSVVPFDVVKVDSVDLAERQFYYDDAGKLIFIQHVFWRWVAWKGVHEVQAWRMENDGRPRLEGGEYLWMDQGTLRRVKPTTYWEWHGQVDVELQNREKLPKEQRIELRK